MKQTGLTHHHIRRGYHTLTFATSVILVAFFAWIMGIALTSVNAQNSRGLTLAVNHPVDPDVKVISENLNLKDVAEEGQSAPVADPEITVVPGESIQQRYILQDGEVQAIFLFKTQFPKFTGHTNVSNGNVGLDIYGSYHVTGKSTVDSNGNWNWESTVPLKPGTFSFTARVSTGASTKVLDTDSFLFEIVLDEDEKPLTPKFNNIPELGNGGNLFDVRAVITSESKEILVGEPIVVDIKFINFGSPNKAVDVEVQYTITNKDEDIVSETSETMAVKDTLEFSKSFLTTSTLPLGEYTLTVAVPSQDLIATATDTFELKSAEDAVAAGDTSGVVPGASSPLANRTLILQILGGMLFLGVVVAYMEYNKVVVLSQNIKQLNEKDLFKKAQA